MHYSSQQIPFVMSVNQPNYTITGRIGLIVSGVLWILSSWRLVFHLFIRKRDEQSENSSSPRRTCRCTPIKWFTRRRTFHCLLWLSQSVEIVAYAELSGILPHFHDRDFNEKLGYVLLDVTGRSILELLSFTTMTCLWLNTAIQSRPIDNVDGQQCFNLSVSPVLFWIITLTLVIASATLSAISFAFADREQTLDSILNTKLSRAQLLLEAIAWGINSMVVLPCLLITGKRIITVVPAGERRNPLIKALLPMLVTSLLYALRCIWLIASIYQASHIERGTWSWFIVFEWGPVLVVVSTLLYSARKRDQEAPMNNGLQQPLLARPPEEAFRAFSQYLNGEEVDDSFNLMSPLQHVSVQTQVNEEVADEETLSTDSYTRQNNTEPS